MSGNSINAARSCRASLPQPTTCPSRALLSRLAPHHPRNILNLLSLSWRNVYLKVMVSPHSNDFVFLSLPCTRYSASVHFLLLISSLVNLGMGARERGRKDCSLSYILFHLNTRITDASPTQKTMPWRLLGGDHGGQVVGAGSHVGTDTQRACRG